MIKLTERGDRLALSTIVQYEWLRGPRTLAELSAQEELFPREAAVAFGPEEAAVAAGLYGRVRRPRGREIDIAVAACALAHGAALCALTPQDSRALPSPRLADVS